jgi:hypothetical protein
MSNLPKNQSNERGYILLLILISAFVFTIALMGITKLSFSTYRASRHALLNLSALAVTEGGADAAIVALNTAANLGSPYTGTTAPSSNICALANSSAKSANAVTLYNNATQGKATYETCIEDNTVINDATDPAKNRYEKVLYSVGKIYQPATATFPVAVSRVKLILEGVSSGDYSVQSGPGGLITNNSAVITNGNVYVGGTLSMSSSSQIGTLSAPSTVKVGNYNCPATSPYSGYPLLCSSINPITIINTAHIYGDVYANSQVDGSGMSNGGLKGSSGVGSVSLPSYDEAGQISRVTNTLGGDQVCGGTSTLTIQANTKITGDLLMSNNCNVYLKGDLWIYGKLTATQKSFLVADPSATSTIHVMIDGASGITLDQQSGVAANNSGVGFEIATNYSTAACGSNCSSVTGQDLVNSMAVTTVNLNNQSLAAGATFYARWTALTLSQGGTIGSILAQKITLANSGSIAFGHSVAGTTTFSWSVRYYEQLPVRDAQNTN